MKRAQREPSPHDTRFEDHFPITVMVQSPHAGWRKSTARCSRLVTTLRDQYLTDKTENEALSGNITTYGGYQTSKKMMFLNRPEPAVQALRDQVDPAGRAALPGQGLRRAGQGTQTPALVSWANILAAGRLAGAAHAPHRRQPHQRRVLRGGAGKTRARRLHRVPEPPSSGPSSRREPNPPACIPNRRPDPVPALLHPLRLSFQGAEERAIVAFDVILQSAQFIF